ncbi:MAG: signal transduction histidine kinase [Oscillospiraceae bacterium]|nr:signal transduction histidine kinase [Oscillospiraceae bacterium]
MTKNPIKLRWKLFCYMGLFVAGMLGALWLYQMFFMQDMFQMIRTDDLNQVAKQVKTISYDDQDAEEQLNEIAFENNVCIVACDSSGATRYSAGHGPNCLIHDLTDASLIELAANTDFNGQKPVDITSEVQTLLAKEEASSADSSDSEQTKSAGESSTAVRVVMAMETDEGVVFLDSSALAPNVTLDNLYTELLYAGGIFLVLTFLLTTLISKGISKPIKEINDKAHALSSGHFDVEFDSRGYLEITQLSETLNYMVGEFRQFETLRQNLIADVSHDLRTPLTAILSRCELTLDFPEEDARKNIEMIYEEARWMSDLVNNLLKISKLRTNFSDVDTVRFNLTDEMEGILRRFERFYQKDGYQFEFYYDKSVFVRADKVRICQVIYNFIHNAVKHAGAERNVVVSQIIYDGEAVIRVHSFGETIPPERLRYIWDRFYQANQNPEDGENGMGLGLSIVKSILEVHHARYGVENCGHDGCVFWFALNTDGEAAQAESEPGAGARHFNRKSKCGEKAGEGDKGKKVKHKQLKLKEEKTIDE